MILSKPLYVIYDLTSIYLQHLYATPIKTKAITSCVFTVLGYLLSQKLAGKKYINNNLIAYGLFGLLFGGTIPHYFYSYVPLLVKHPLAILLIERLIYTPCFQAFTIYMLARFEGKSHTISCDQLKKLFQPVIMTNLKYLTLIQFINIKYVPPMLQVLMLNIINLLWLIYFVNRQTSSIKDKVSKK